MKNKQAKNSQINSMKNSKVKNTKVNNMKNKGFTLIELIVVMVILGTLAVTVAPRFVDITGTAQVSVMKGLKSAISSAGAIVYSQSLIDVTNKNDADDDKTVTVDSGQTVDLVYGYPAATKDGLLNALDIEVESADDTAPSGDNDFGYFLDTASTSIYIFTGNTKPTGSNDTLICAVKYTEASFVDPVYKAPVITTHFDKC